MSIPLAPRPLKSTGECYFVISLQKKSVWSQTWTVLVSFLVWRKVPMNQSLHWLLFQPCTVCWLQKNQKLCSIWYVVPEICHLLDCLDHWGRIWMRSTADRPHSSKASAHFSGIDWFKLLLRQGEMCPSQFHWICTIPNKFKQLEGRFLSPETEWLANCLWTP